MTTYYVGSGGSDAANGLSWANRKLTLNGAEDVPVAAADTVYVAPGVYRELLTVDVSGSAGNIITYIADETGQNTDGIGGEVRITGSDNDTTVTRANCITATTKTHRTFRGFHFDMASTYVVNLATSCTDWIIEDCAFGSLPQSCTGGVYISGASQANVTVRRCLFRGTNLMRAIWPVHTSTVDNAGHVVENCDLLAGRALLEVDRVGGIVVRNCSVIGHTGNSCARVFAALTVGQTVTINNCIFALSGTGLQATVTGEIVEDYNSFFGVGTARTNVATGANSNVYPPLLAMPLLYSGVVLPSSPHGALSQWSPVRAITGSGTATDDLYGRTRPATAAKLSWGPVQYVPISRETTTKRTGAASIKLADAGRHQVFVPVTAVSTVFSVYVYREADYTGTLPQMIIKQPGVADDTTTDTGSVSTWNQLTRTMTPAATPGYVIVELVSNNTAAATNFDVFFDDLTVT